MARPGNVNLYASREGALYQSYDNYAGAAGFYDPYQEVAQQPVSDPQMQASVFVCASGISAYMATEDPRLCIRRAQCTPETGQHSVRARLVADKRSSCPCVGDFRERAIVSRGA